MLSSSYKKMIRQGLFIGFFSFLSQANAATDVKILCPESLAVAETASGVDVDWEVIVDGGRGAHVLDGVRVYDGHPRELANLVPDSVRREKGLQKTTWRFSNARSENYWLACSYQNTTLLAVKKLTSTLKSCQVTQQLLPSGAVLKIKSMICQ